MSDKDKIRDMIMALSQGDHDTAQQAASEVMAAKSARLTEKTDYDDPDWFKKENEEMQRKWVARQAQNDSEKVPKMPPRVRKAYLYLRDVVGAPVIARTDSGGVFIISGESDRPDLIDYYGEFRGGDMYVAPSIEAAIDKYGLEYEWDSPGGITVYDNNVVEGEDYPEMSPVELPDDELDVTDIKMNNSTRYSNYLPTHERPVVTAILRAILAAGKTITINDGEEDVITSNKLTELRPELAATGEDYIKFDGGWFRLIYNNGSEDDPMVVIADYSATEFCEEIWNALNAKY